MNHSTKRNSPSACFHAYCPNCGKFAYDDVTDDAAGDASIGDATGEKCLSCGKDLFDDSVELILIPPDHKKKDKDRYVERAERHASLSHHAGSAGKR